MTKLGLVNIIIVQWFFFRIAKIVEEIDKKQVQTYWGFIFPVLPITGWGTPYIPSKRYTIKLFRKKVK